MSSSDDDDDDDESSDDDVNDDEQKISMFAKMQRRRRRRQTSVKANGYHQTEEELANIRRKEYRIKVKGDDSRNVIPAPLESFKDLETLYGCSAVFDYTIRGVQMARADADSTTSDTDDVERRGGVGGGADWEREDARFFCYLYLCDSARGKMGG